MAQPVLYLMLGYPGAGKTSAAKIIGELTGATHLWADQERRKHYGEPNYSHAENLHLYGLLNDETMQLLAQGQSVIFDTGFNYYKDRQLLRQVANGHNAICKIIWIATHKDIAKERAIKDAHKQDTRVLGNMTHEDFERISSNLEPPRPDEDYIKLDGTKITPDYIAQQLELT